MTISYSFIGDQNIFVIKRGEEVKNEVHNEENIYNLADNVHPHDIVFIKNRNSNRCDNRRPQNYTKKS